MFTTQFSKKNRVRSKHGNPYVTEYIAEYDTAGVLQLRENGKKNLYEYIQSHEESVNVKRILERYRQGDVTALNRVQAKYMDVTDMPKSLVEAINLVEQSKVEFNQLPVDVKAKFNHNYAEWLLSAGSGEWLEKMGVPKKAEENSEVIPKDNEGIRSEE